jgi:hypothetical protein
VNADDHIDVVPETGEIFTKRLRLRSWSLADTAAALEIFGSTQVSRWLTPALPPIDTHEHMQVVLESWVAENSENGRPLGRWAIEHKDHGVLVGAVSLLPLPPEGIDLEIGWQVAPRALGSRIRRRSRSRRCASGLHGRRDRGIRSRSPRESPRHRHRTSCRHGMDRGNHQILRTSTTGLPRHKSRFGLPDAF